MNYSLWLLMSSLSIFCTVCFSMIPDDTAMLKISFDTGNQAILLEQLPSNILGRIGFYSDDFASLHCISKTIHRSLQQKDALLAGLGQRLYGHLLGYAQQNVSAHTLALGICATVDRYWQVLEEKVHLNQGHEKALAVYELGKMYALLTRLNVNGIHYHSTFVTHDLSRVSDQQNDFIEGILYGCDGMAKRPNGDYDFVIHDRLGSVFKNRIQSLERSFYRIMDVIRSPDFLQVLHDEILHNNFYSDYHHYTSKPFYPYKRHYTNLLYEVITRDCSLWIQDIITLTLQRRKNAFGYGELYLHEALHNHRWAIAHSIVDKMDSSDLKNVDPQCRAPLVLAIQNYYSSSAYQSGLIEKIIAKMSAVDLCMRNGPRKHTFFDIGLECNYAPVIELLIDKVPVDHLLTRSGKLRESPFFALFKKADDHNRLAALEKMIARAPVTALDKISPYDKKLVLGVGERGINSIAQMLKKRKAVEMLSSFFLVMRQRGHMLNLNMS